MFVISDINTSYQGFSLPLWVGKFLEGKDKHYTNDAERMALAIDLSRLNVKQQTGGPFGAAIFDLDTQLLVSVGINLVVPSQCSINHAEMVAITLAQQALHSFNLKTRGNFALFTSCEPCAMCFGAMPWSGIKRLVCGASSADAEAIGFDEGPKHQQWKQELEQRGIQVSTQLMQAQASQVLQDYQQQQGLIYNS